MTDVLANVTGTTAIPAAARPIDRTRTSEDVLSETVGFLRTQARLVGQDVATLHNETLTRQPQCADE